MIGSVCNFFWFVDYKTTIKNVHNNWQLFPIGTSLQRGSKLVNIAFYMFNPHAFSKTIVKDNCRGNFHLDSWLQSSNRFPTNTWLEVSIKSYCYALGIYNLLKCSQKHISEFNWFSWNWKIKYSVYIGKVIFVNTVILKHHGEKLLKPVGNR